jgi:hypothetical protein
MVLEMKEDRTADYWNRKWKLKEQDLREEVLVDGSDGEGALRARR